MTIDEILSQEAFATFAPISVSPDGELLALSLQSHRRKVVGGAGDLPSGFTVGVEGCEISLVEVATGNFQNLTQAWGASWGPSWSPDGHHLAFYSDKEDQPRLWLWERESMRMRTACDADIRPCLPQDVSSRWLPDGERIIVKLRPGDAPAGPQSPPAAPHTPSARVFRFAPDESPSGLSHFEARLDFRADLGLVQVATGQVQRLAKGYAPLGLEVSPDGRKVAFVHDGIVHCLSLDSASVEALTGQLHFRGGFGPILSWSPDGRSLAFTTHGDPATCQLYVLLPDSADLQALTSQGSPSLGNMYEPPLWTPDGSGLLCVAAGHVWLVAVESREAQCLTEGWDWDAVRAVHKAESSTVWSPDDGASAYVQAFHPETKRSSFHRVPLQGGALVPVLDEARLYHKRQKGDVCPATGAVLYLAEDYTHPSDVWRLDAGSQHARPVTSLNPQITAPDLPNPRIVTWTTPLGTQLQGALLLPEGHCPLPLPVVTKVYGGSLRSDQLNYFGAAESQGAPVDSMHPLTCHGYAVFMPDIPILGNEPIEELCDAVLSGVQELVSSGVADPARLGVMGHSYGGYCVNALITQTTQFSAAVSVSSFCNLVSAYGSLTDMGTNPGVSRAERGQWRMDGSPWEFPERYARNSPIHALDQVRTPLLLIHGDQDITCPMSQAAEMFTGLRRLGKKVTLAQYLGEDHWPGTWRYPNASDFWQRVLSWLDAHLTG